jgi:hypothetical protein
MQNAAKRRSYGGYLQAWLLWIAFVVLALGTVPGNSQNVIRGPYLQCGSASNMVVRWRTASPCDSRVRFGTNLTDLEFLANDTTITSEHKVRVTNLNPNTKYFYSIGTSSNALAGGDSNHFFVTSPPQGLAKPTRIWIIGDAGSVTSQQIAVRNAYESNVGIRPADLWLMLGDNAYETGTDAEYQWAVFNIYTNQLRQSVLWPTLGNHDTAGFIEFHNNYPYFEIFSLPKNGEAGGIPSGTEHYYSFDYGNIHFICLDSMTASRSPNGGMAMWLTNDLANVTADWIIAYWHHPPYSKGSHDSDTELELVEMRQNFLPILEQGGVDLVLNGHSHSYERSCFLDNHYGRGATFSSTNQIQLGSGRPNQDGAYIKPADSPVAHQGTVYAVVGSSGKTSGGPLNHPAMFVSLNELGSLVLDINSNRLDAKFIRENGNTNDSFTIFKGSNAPPVAIPLIASVLPDSATNLSLTGSDADGNVITFASVGLPSHGLISSFEPFTGSLTYTPAHGYIGADSFTFQASDGLTVSSAVTGLVQVLQPVDANANGVPDDWEALYGISDPDADSDQDGASNRQEYWANTNPTNGASVLRITSAFRNDSGQFVMNWSSVGGTRYRVSYYDDRTGGGPTGAFVESVLTASVEMDPSPLGSASTKSFTDTSAPVQLKARYYRVQVTQ